MTPTAEQLQALRERFSPAGEEMPLWGLHMFQYFLTQINEIRAQATVDLPQITSDAAITDFRDVDLSQEPTVEPPIGDGGLG